MRRRIRIGIPDGALNDYLKGMTNERAAYEIIRLATNNLHGFSDAQALNVAASIPDKQNIEADNSITCQSQTADSNTTSTKNTGEVSFADDLQMLI